MNISRADSRGATEIVPHVYISFIDSVGSENDDGRRPKSHAVMITSTQSLRASISRCALTFATDGQPPIRWSLSRFSSSAQRSRKRQRISPEKLLQNLESSGRPTQRTDFAKVKRSQSSDRPDYRSRDSTKGSAWTSQSSSNRRDFVKDRPRSFGSHDGRISNHPNPPIVPSGSTESVVKFAEAIEKRDVVEAINLYATASKNLPGSKVLSHYLILLGRAIETYKDDEEIIDHIYEAAARVRTDSVQAGVPPSDPVYKRLFAIYRELSMWEDGASLWSWMTGQQEEILFLSTYAAAIEFFTAANKSLTFMENIYHDALSSNQGSFLQYHLDSNAVLGDRETIDTAHFPSDAEVLLEKILTARLKRDDKVGAYLLLDTSLRVFGKLTERTVDALIRNLDSLDDRYVILRLALRAKVCPRPSTMQTFLYDLTRAPGKKDLSVAEYVSQKARELNAALKLMVCWYDACGQFDERLIGTSLLPVQDVVLRVAQLDELKASHALAESAEQLIETLYPLLTPPATTLHNALLNIGSCAGHPELLQRTLEKLLARGGEPDIATCRALLNGASSSGSLDVLKSAWAELETMAMNQQYRIARLEFDVLIRSVEMLKDPAGIDLLQSCASKHDYSIHEGIFNKLRLSCSRTASFSLKRPPTKISAHSTTQLLHILTHTQETIRSIIIDPSFTVDHTQLGMYLSPPRKPIASPSQLYQVYDVLSIDPSTRQHNDFITISYDELAAHPVLKQRFLNWLTVTELLFAHHTRAVVEARRNAPVVLQDEETGLVVQQQQGSSSGINGDSDGDDVLQLLAGNELGIQDELSFEQLLALVCRVRHIKRQF